MRSVQRVIVTAICFGRHRERAQRVQHVMQLQSYLGALRRDFGDAAPLTHDWA
jgi:hypothetical protein